MLDIFADDARALKPNTSVGACSSSSLPACAAVSAIYHDAMLIPSGIARPPLLVRCSPYHHRARSALKMPFASVTMHDTASGAKATAPAPCRHAFPCTFNVRWPGALDTPGGMRRCRHTSRPIFRKRRPAQHISSARMAISLRRAHVPPSPRAMFRRRPRDALIIRHFAAQTCAIPHTMIICALQLLSSPTCVYVAPASIFLPGLRANA